MSFKTLKEQMGTLAQEKKSLLLQLDRTSIMMDLKELEYKLEHINTKIDSFKKQIKDKEHMLSNLNAKDLASSLEQKLGDYLARKVEILVE